MENGEVRVWMTPKQLDKWREYNEQIKKEKKEKKLREKAELFRQAIGVQMQVGNVGIQTQVGAGDSIAMERREIESELRKILGS